MFITNRDIYQMWNEDRGHANSSLRIRLTSFPYRGKGERSAPLCFPSSDRPAIESLMEPGGPAAVRIAILQAVLKRNTDGYFTQDLQLVLCKVVDEDFSSRYQETRLDGFVTYSGMCNTDSLCDLHVPNSRSQTRYTVTPGRVGVYAADHVNASFYTDHPKDQVCPLRGWVEAHPKNPQMKRLVAVDELHDLDVIKRKAFSLGADSL